MVSKMKTTASVCVMVLSIGGFALTGQASASPASITSFANSKTGDAKTMFPVKQGEKITFSVKAEGAEKYVWLVDGTVQKKAKGASFTWTVPNKKGMWKILLKTTNKEREDWVKQKALSWNKWVTTLEATRVSPEEKERFVQDMTELYVYPLEAQTEWIVSAFLTTVKPGESIQKAIDSLPAEGGIVELAPGTHDVDDTKYPPVTFPAVGLPPFGNKKKPPEICSIIIRRSNVAIHGTRKAIVRHHNKSANCFWIGPKKAATPNVYVENITIRGFTTASTYTRKDRARKALIEGCAVRNFTVENMHDTSWARVFVWAWGPSRPHRNYAQNIYFKNNRMEHCGLGAIQARHLHILNNTILGSPSCFGLHPDTRISNLYVIGNRAINAGANSGVVLDNPTCCLMSDNFVQGTQAPMRVNHGGHLTIIENNTFAGGRRNGMVIWTQFKVDTLIRNNRIYNSGSHGISSHAYKGSQGARIRLISNIIYNSGGDGIRTGVESLILDISNNIIANSKGYGINHTGGKITLSHNDIWNNGQGNYNGIAAGPGDFSKDPLFANLSEGDFHLKSKTGRWDTKAKKWVKDKTQSPCIDTGDPKADFSKEPAPNGGRVNVGAYGNTKEASKSTTR